MRGDELRALAVEFGLPHVDLARLLGVTSRAVTLWIAEERNIPGPAEAYLRIFRLLPPNLRQIELNRLKQKGSGMRDGIFGMAFQARGVGGMGILIFESGRIYGSDTERVKYDGSYIYNEATRLAAINVKVTFPPHVKAVFGVSNPYEWSFDVTAEFDPNKDSGLIAVKTSIGQPIQAQYRYLRALPEAA
jgi:hypothetical protein